MLIDLHCHTQPLSRCSDLSPERLIALAKARGLDGLCFTEHDTEWTGPNLAELSERERFPLFAAVEYTMPDGHVLAFGVPPGSYLGTEQLWLAAESNGGVLFLAHPARDGLLRVTSDTVRWFAGVEAENGSDSRLQNLAAAGLGKRFALPGIGGSDAHTEAEVGRAATRFEESVASTAELVDALKSGRYTAVRLD